MSKKWEIRDRENHELFDTFDNVFEADRVLTMLNAGYYLEKINGKWETLLC